MKHYKVLNLNRQHIGPFVATEQWMKEAERTKGMMKQFQNMGECDASGNLLADISKENFSAAKTDIPPVFTETKSKEENGNTTGKQAGSGETGTSEIKGSKKGNASAGNKANTGSGPESVTK